MKKSRKILLILVCFLLVNVSVMGMGHGFRVSAEETGAVPGESILLSGLQKENDGFYYYEQGVCVKNEWKTIRDESGKSYKYYFGADGKAYAAKDALASFGYKKNVVLKKVGKYYYGFDRLGHMVKSGYYTNPFKRDRKGDSYTYYFDKYGRRNNAKSSAVTKAGKYGKNAKTLRKLLGKPSKTKRVNSCSPIPGKDYKLVYKNLCVMIHRNKNGSEVVYEILPM